MDSKDQSERNEPGGLGRAYREAGPYIGLGIQFTLSILLFLLGGYWIDKKLGTQPLFILLGTFLGAAVGFYGLYKTVFPGDKQKQGGKGGEVGDT